MPEYLVEWRIELSASSPEAAAREALRIQRDPTSLATVFSVREMDDRFGARWHTLDITAIDDKDAP